MEKLKQFYKNHPFITVNIVTLVLLIFNQSSWAAVVFFISLIAWAIRANQIKKEKMQALRASADAYIAEVKQNKKMPTITTNVFLGDGEYAFLESGSRLFEPRSVRNYAGTGASFRVMKGVRIGGYSGRSESHSEWRRLDQGKVVLTSKKLVFNGGKENRTVQLKDIVSINVMRDAIELASEKRQKSSIFAVDNPYIWGAAINILKRVKDPMHLEEVNLDVTFE